MDGNSSGSTKAKKTEASSSKDHGADNIPNQVPDDDVTQRLHETCKTTEFMNPRKEPGDFSAHIFKNEDPQTTFVSETEGANSADVQKEKSSVEPTSTGSPLPKRNFERILKCRELKEEGNKLVKSQEWRLAMKKYHHALMYIKGITDKNTALAGIEDTLHRQKPTEQEKKDATELILSLWNNLSLCLLKLEDWEKVVKHTSKILTMRPNDLKALYRRGKAYTQIGKLEVAEKDLKEAQRLDSRDKMVKEQIGILQKKKAEQQEKERKLYSSMFRET